MKTLFYILTIFMFTLSACSVSDSGCDNTFTGEYVTAVREPEPFGVFVKDSTQYNVFMSTESLSKLTKGQTYTLCVEYRNGKMYH